MTNLKKMREKKGMTQAELAEKSGVNLRMIQHYEQGYKDIKNSKVITALSLANALKCDINEII